MNADLKHTYPIVFRVSAPSVNPRSNENVYLVGSCVALGNWQETESVILGTSNKIYPIWTSKPIDIEATEAANLSKTRWWFPFFRRNEMLSSFEYKYFRRKELDREGDENCIGCSYWEPIQPRTMRIPLEHPVIATSDFGIYGTTKYKMANEDDLEFAETVVSEYLETQLLHNPNVNIEMTNSVGCHNESIHTQNCVKSRPPERAAITSNPENEENASHYVRRLLPIYIIVTVLFSMYKIMSHLLKFHGIN